MTLGAAIAKYFRREGDSESWNGNGLRVSVYLLAIVSLGKYNYLILIIYQKFTMLA